MPFVGDTVELVDTQHAEEHGQAPEPPAAGHYRTYDNGDIKHAGEEACENVFHFAICLFRTNVRIFHDMTKTEQANAPNG